MNKCIRQNWKIWNHIVMRPLTDNITVPEDKKELTEWAESVWNHLVNEDVKREGYWIKKKTGQDKYNITLWTDDKFCYLIVCLRTEYNTDSTTVYINDLTNDNINDFKAIAKMVHLNIGSFIGESKKNVREFNKLINERERHTKLN